MTQSDRGPEDVGEPLLSAISIVAIAKNSVITASSSSPWCSATTARIARSRSALRADHLDPLAAVVDLASMTCRTAPVAFSSAVISRSSSAPSSGST